MEVHHHSHKGNKKFKDYLSEGVMIFVAVTMGFFAERLRESIDIREREHHYINSLIDDLKQDQISLNEIIRRNQRKVSLLDSLLSLSGQASWASNDRSLLYRYSQNSVLFYSGFLSTDATMIQLKNAGGLQYIKKHVVANSIAKYDDVIRYVYAAEVPYSKAINDAMDAASEILIFKVKNDSTYFKNGVYSNNVPVLTHDWVKMEVFFNKIWIERGWTQNYVVNLQNAHRYTQRLIHILKKENGND